MLAKKLKLAAVFFVAAAALTGCESAQDKADKPALVEGMVTDAVERCDLQGDTATRYSHRLAEALTEARSDDLRAIRGAQVTVCLDRRLKDQVTGIFGAEAKSLYYPEDRVITLVDNTSWIGVQERHAQTLDEVADIIREVEKPPVMGMFCTKYCFTLEDAHGHTTYNKTPGIKSPPLKR